MSFTLKLLTGLLGASAQTSNSLTKDLSKNQQVIVRQDGVQAHILTAKEDGVPQRSLIAVFEGNSGAYVDFAPIGSTYTYTDGEAWEWPSVIEPTENWTITAPTSSNGVFKVTNEFTLNQDCEALVSMASSMRFIRDWNESGGKTNLGDEENPNLTVDPIKTGIMTVEEDVVTVRSEFPLDTGDSIRFIQMTLKTNGTAKFVLMPKDERNGDFKATVDTFKVQANPNSKITIVQEFSTNQAIEVPMDVEDILKDKEVISSTGESLIQGLAFLSHKSGWVAGSHRFLTYFGRDTLMTLWMMKDQVATSLYTNVLDGALSRVRWSQNDGGILENFSEWYPSVQPIGLLAHEDEIGIFPQIQVQAEYRADYKMLDTHFLLMPLIGYAIEEGFFDFSVWAEEEIDLMYTDGGKTPKKKRGDLLALNMKLIYDLTRPMVTAENKLDGLLRIYHDSVGNWRDSNPGLGDAVYPTDINLGFVQGSLSTMDKYYSKYFNKYLSPIDSDINSANLTQNNDAWKFSNIVDMFKFYVSKGAAESSVNSYVDFLIAFDGVDLSERVKYIKDTYKDDELYPEFIIGLGLRELGSVVPIINTDMGLIFAYSDIIPDDVVYNCLKSMIAPFPFGLKTEVGLVVANPALAFPFLEGNRYLDQFGRGSYHGAVVWSWQHHMLDVGLEKQCKDSVEKKMCNKAKSAIWDIFENNPDSVEYEMWSWDLASDKKALVLQDFSMYSPTEGNLAQLWSYAGIGKTRPATDSASKITALSIGLVMFSLLL